ALASAASTEAAPAASIASDQASAVAAGASKRNATKAIGESGLRRLLALGHPLLEIVNRRAAAQERIIEQQFLVQRNIGLDALDHHFRQRHAHAGDRLL